MTSSAGPSPRPGVLDAGGWLRPVELCLATAVPTSDEQVWPDPADFVWRSAEDDQERRRRALEALLEPAGCVTTAGPVLAVYRITSGSHAQTGLLADVRVEAYQQGRIRGHEHTRYDKEEALFAELDAVEALVGPVALAHEPDPELAGQLEALARGEPSAEWTTADGARHELWIVEDDALAELVGRCSRLDPLYIIDGHHRIAAAARRAAGRQAEPEAAGDDPWASFLAAVFPADHLAVRATHRVVELDDPAEAAAVLDRLAERGRLEPVGSPEDARPDAPRVFGVGVGGRWYRLDELEPPERAPEPYPDVQALDDLVLRPLLGIADPRTDRRIDFVPDLGDLRGLAERCASGRELAFLVRPVTVEEVFAVADAGAALPPKSTWFVPKPIKGAVLPAPRLPRRGGA